MTTVGGSDPGVTGQTAGGEPPYVRLPRPNTMFTSRAQRFAATVEGSEIADYLLFMAEVAAAQAEAAATIEAPPLDPAVHDVVAHGMPPLSRAIAALPGAQTALDALIAALKTKPIAAGPAAIVENVTGLDRDERSVMLTGIADGVYEIERLGEGAIVAAALQVWYAAHAVQLDVARLRNLGEVLCPCCGAAPTSSLIVNWPEATGNRYLTCSLCLSMWNHVRVKCTACGSTKGISYRQIEGSTGEVAGEVCETCGAYAKHLNQIKNAALDPIADDVASYGLDLMLREDGWRRAGLNPFLVLA